MTADPPPQRAEKLLIPREVAQLFDVNAETVRRWADRGQLPCIRTPSGRYRFRLSDIRQALKTHGKP